MIRCWSGEDRARLGTTCSRTQSSAREGHMSQQAMESELLGKTVSGRVTAKTEDGVLVDIGDQLVGLLPVDEMKGSDPWEWQERLQGLTVGDEVLVKVIQVKPRHKNGEPNLLLSEHEANLDLLAAQLTGARVSGHIVEKTTHGVFVNLHNGLEGFMHVSD